MYYDASDADTVFYMCSVYFVCIQFFITID